MADSIIARMGLDSGPFQRGLRGAKGMLSGWVRSARTELGGLIIGGALLKGMQSLFEKFDRFAKLATKFAAPVESIQRLDHVSQLAGTDIEALNKVLIKTAIAAGQANRGSKTQADLFEAVGINAREFVNLSLEDKVVALAQAFQRSNADGGDSASMLELLGTRGSELIPLLAAGGDALKTQMAGVKVVAAETVRAMEAANDTIETMMQQLRAWGAEAVGIIAKAAGALGGNPGDVGVGGKDRFKTFLGVAPQKIFEETGNALPNKAQIKAKAKQLAEEEAKAAREAEQQKATSEPRPDQTVPAHPRGSGESGSGGGNTDAGRMFGPGDDDAEMELYQQRERAAEEARKAEEDAAHERLQAARTLQDAENDLARIKIENSRAMMTALEHINSLEAERADLIREAARQEGVAKVETQQKIATLGGQIDQEKQAVAHEQKAAAVATLNETPDERRERRRGERKAARDQRVVEKRDSNELGGLVRKSREAGGLSGDETSRMDELLGEGVKTPDKLREEKGKEDRNRGIAGGFDKAFGKTVSDTAKEGAAETPAAMARAGAEPSRDSQNSAGGSLSEVVSRLDDIKTAITDFDMGEGRGS